MHPARVFDPPRKGRSRGACRCRELGPRAQRASCVRPEILPTRPRIRKECRWNHIEAAPCRLKGPVLLSTGDWCGKEPTTHHPSNGVCHGISSVAAESCVAPIAQRPAPIDPPVCDSSAAEIHACAAIYIVQIYHKVIIITAGSQAVRGSRGGRAIAPGEVDNVGVSLS